MILPEIVYAQKPISREWESYCHEALEKGGLELDGRAKTALKRAFFAGATSMSCIIVDLSELDRQTAEALSERIQKELYEFGRAVKTSRAIK